MFLRKYRKVVAYGNVSFCKVMRSSPSSLSLTLVFDLVFGFSVCFSDVSASVREFESESELNSCEKSSMGSKKDFFNTFHPFIRNRSTYRLFLSFVTGACDGGHV